MIADEQADLKYTYMHKPRMDNNMYTHLNSYHFLLDRS